MSDDFQEKTEEPTQKKLTDARKKGQVAKSADLTSSTVLLFGMSFLLIFGPYFYGRIANLAVMIFMHLDEPYGSVEAVVMWARLGMFYVVMILAPLFLGVFVAAVVINLLQVGFEITPESLKPKWNNLNLFNPKNYKKFFSSQALMKMLFGFGKLGVIGFVGYYIIFGSLPHISRLMEATTWALFIFICYKGFLIGVSTAIILITLGTIDFIYQRWKFMKDLKMTRTEVKDERKQTEGDVQVKSRLRAMMQAFTQNRMKANIPKADVVIANPIHYAIAVKYDPEKMPAPICVAKGARRLALVIRGLAEEHGVPVVENPPLARALYSSVEVGQLVPPDFYHSVAEVLAYVYRLDEDLAKTQ